MADLTDKQAAQTIKIAGADPTTGVEDNYAEVDASGNVQTLVNNASGASAVNIQDGGNSITVDATSWPLPTGASTSANQTTIISDIGATNETVAPTDTSTSGLNGLIKRINQHLTTLEGYVDGLEGLVTTTNTEIGATNETTAASDSATSGLNGLTKRINAHLTTIEGYVDGLETLIGTTNTEIGGLTETAPASDTASSGLNGRLQRIAQRLTSLIAFYSADFGVSSASIRTAALIGNATGAAAFNSGTTSAQTIRAVLSTDQTGINTFLDKTASGALTALNQTVTIATNGMGSATAQVAGTYSAVLSFEASIDSGTTYFGITGIYTDANSAPVSLTSTTGHFKFNVSSYTNFRVRVSSFTSGTANVVINGGSGDFDDSIRLLDSVGNYLAGGYGSATGSLRTASQIGNSTGAAAFGAGATSAQTIRTVLVTDQTSIPVAGDVASGTTDSGNPVKTGGVVNFNGTNFTDGQRANVQMDSTGAEYVNTSGRMPSYSASSTFTAVSGATDIFTITGSATKTIRIRRVTVSGTNTGNTNALIVMLKRSTANTGGTSTNLTEVPHDSNDAAATATALSYTANPTTGTLVGNLYHRLMYLPSLTSSNVRSEFEMGWGQDGAKPIILRGTSEVFAINMNSVAITGTTVMNISIDWTEN